MYSDRELLELAAKVGGYDVVWNEHWKCFQHRNPSPDKFGNVRHPWVPLDDDGDALRLAVKLGLKLEKHEEYYPYFSAEKAPDVFIAEDVIKNGGDELAAARRAIVRAAAAIGEAMQ